MNYCFQTDKENFSRASDVWPCCFSDEVAVLFGARALLSDCTAIQPTLKLHL